MVAHAGLAVLEKYLPGREDSSSQAHTPSDRDHSASQEGLRPSLLSFPLIIYLCAASSRSRGSPSAEMADFLDKLSATAREPYNPPTKEGDTWIGILPRLMYL